MGLKIKKPSDIPGWTFKTQHQEYKKLVKELPENPRILEIGCGWGRSTWAWLDALPTTASYYVLDKFCLESHWCYRSQYYFYLKTNPNVAKAIKKWYRNNVKQEEIFNRIISNHPNKEIIKNVWSMDSDRWIGSKDFTNNWDLVYLDDRHEYDVMKKWLDLFSNVQIVCGDDYNTTFPGVIRAVDKYVKKQNVYSEVDQQKNFFVIKNKLTL